MLLTHVNCLGGAQIMKDAKDRQDRTDAAADKWQAQEAAKQDACIAAAIARQQRIQADLEQARFSTAKSLFLLDVPRLSRLKSPGASVCS